MDPGEEDEFLENKVAFLKLSITCQQALSAPSKSNIEGLNAVIKFSPDAVLQENQSRVLLTLLQIISNESLRSDVKLSAVSILECILKKFPVITDFFILRSIIQQLIQLLFSPEDSKLVADIPEELHLVSLNTICTLLKNLPPKQIEKFYTSQAAPFLGVLVCLCLEEAGKQQFRKIKVAAIECLMACGQVLEKPPDEDDVSTLAGNLFMNFVPGIVKGLKQVICAYEKQGHAVTVVAVRAWGRLIAQVMDSPTAALENPNLSPKSLSSAGSITEVQQLIAENRRNAAFFKMADQMLQGNIEAVSSVQSHSHHKVRLELVSSSKLILLKCSKNLPSCVVPLLEVLVALSEDEVPEVASAANDSVEAVSHVFDEETNLIEILETNLFRVAEQLPTVFMKKDDRGQLSSLGLLVGYLRLLSHRLHDALLLHCHSVLNSLMFVSTFEIGHIVLLEDMSLKEEATMFERRPWLQHKYFHSRDVGSLLKKACGMLSQEAHLVVPQLLTTMVDKPSVQKEAVHLINLILGNLIQYSDAKSVAESFVDPAIWDIPLTPEGKTTMVEAKSNVVLACLLCEGLAVAAASSGTKIRQLLSIVLYPVLERAGSAIEVVSLAGRMALASIAKSLDHETTAALICKEAEYFTHFVTVKLRRPKDNPGALLVLSAVLKHGSQEILPSIELIISDVLTRCQDNRVIPRYMDVFLALITNVGQFCRPVPSSKAEDKRVLNSSKQFHKSPVVEELLLIEKFSRASIDDQEDPDEEHTSFDKQIGQLDDDEESPKFIPIYITMIENVLQRCLHMLPSKDKEIQILALRALKRGLPILELHEDQLLPLVHKLWSPLVQRFSPSQDVVVLRQSFELLCIVAECSKSFIRHRCLELVLPSICQFVQKQASTTSKQRGVVLSQSMKLQRVALDRLGPLAENLDLQEEEIHMILRACSPYLSSEQPLVLQESCIALFKHITKINCDAVWLRLNTLWNEGKELKSPSHGCINIRLPLLPPAAAQYKANVQMLLQFIG